MNYFRFGLRVIRRIVEIRRCFAEKMTNIFEVPNLESSIFVFGILKIFSAIACRGGAYYWFSRTCNTTAILD